MSKEKVISISGLSKEFSNKEVLRVRDLSITEGSIVGVIGPSGAGKSTLLRIINLLEAPTTGEISYFGNSVTKASHKRLCLQRQMQMVFQKPVLLNRTVYENIAYPLRAHGLSKQEVQKRVDLILAQTQMESLSKQMAATLSGGEAQRIAFARALVMKPRILLLDEATANLDPANVELLENMIISANRFGNTTVIMVTHNLFQARRLATEVVFLYQGNLIETGKTEQIFERPREVRTKNYIEGKMIY